MLKGTTKLGTVAAALLLAGMPAFSAGPPKLSGSIAGIVRNASGIPQMGASVLLFSKYEKLLGRAITNERGAFGFDELSPDLYSVRVSLASFLPAMKDRIAVQPGMQSLLYINLANMLSSIELVYAAPGQGALMSDDWKWTLKSAAATRPVLRFDSQDIGISQSDPQHSALSIFSDTRALVKVSAGDFDTLLAPGDEQDLGTAFALATSLFGRNQLQVSGNLGYGMRTGIPTAGFRATYSREGMTPTISVTVRQVSLPTRVDVMPVSQDGLPVLRSVSLEMADHVALTPDLMMEYGTSLDSVSFAGHLNTVSPYVRFTYDLGALGSAKVAFSSGGAPTPLMSTSPAVGTTETQAGSVALAQDLAALAMMPRFSLVDGRPAVERTQNVEIGYEKVFGSRTVEVSAYHETVSNAAVMMAAPDNLFAAGDVLPDLSSNASIVNIGNFERYGYAASFTQTLGDKLEIGGSAGRTGALTFNDPEIAADADQLRSKIGNGQRFWGSARARATLPGAGTQLNASYEWTDYSALMPTHYYITQKAYPEPGLNFTIRQPIPGLPGMPGRLEATLDFRNVTAQGYIPVSVESRRVLLIQNPRALRGGLSFVF